MDAIGAKAVVAGAVVAAIRRAAVVESFMVLYSFCYVLETASKLADNMMLWMPRTPKFNSRLKKILDPTRGVT